MFSALLCQQGTILLRTNFEQTFCSVSVESSLIVPRKRAASDSKYLHTAAALTAQLWNRQILTRTT